MAIKLGLGIGIHIDFDDLAQLDFGDIGLGHGEAQAHYTGVFQTHDIGTRLQILTKEDIAQTDHAAEGGADFTTGNGRLQTLDIRFQRTIGCFRLIQLLFGDGAGLVEVLETVELGFCRRQLGLGGAQIGLLHAGVEAQQQLVSLDRLA